MQGRATPSAMPRQALAASRANKEVSAAQGVKKVASDHKATPQLITLSSEPDKEVNLEDVKVGFSLGGCKFEGIVVKVMSKALEEKGYYKQKGVVRKVIDRYVGEIEMLESKHVLRVDQEELETVLPQIGGLIKIVNGAYRGSNARLLGINTEKFCAKVQIEKGVYDGRVIQAIAYEDICKVL